MNDIKVVAIIPLACKRRGISILCKNSHS
jgi:hypothetical protein